MSLTGFRRFLSSRQFLLGVMIAAMLAGVEMILLQAEWLEWLFYGLYAAVWVVFIGRFFL